MAVFDEQKEFSRLDVLLRVRRVGCVSVTPVC